MLKKFVFAVSLVLALAFAGAAVAGKTSGSSSITGPFVVAASPTGTSATATSTSTPHFGDAITFDVSTTATDMPFVNLVCYQNGALVANGTGLFAPADLSVKTFNLTSGLWTGGAAECTATLGMFTGSDKYKALASTSFHVDA
jgi:hypothetical protein